MILEDLRYSTNNPFFPAEFSLQSHGAMLKATSLESLLYGIHAALAIFTVWRVVVRDKGRGRFIRCGLVIVMYLIATSPLAVRPIFVQGRDDKTQETTYIYSPEWILLSSMSFMADMLIMSCIVIWQCWIHCGHGWMFAIIPGLCTIVGTIFAGFGLYWMTAMPPPGNACVAQVDWMLPYFSMLLAVMLLCMLVIMCRIMMTPHIKDWFWIKVIVESLLLFAAGPIVFLVVYITSDVRTSCPLLVVTMSTGFAPILAIAQVPSNGTTLESAPLVHLVHRTSTDGNAGLASCENPEDLAARLQGDTMA
ncbi:hypothetical protein DFS33DRAFT_251011 [Desarmillaria ectypa]|nr:hypothetical protein DFS33DRAFT_251011 [Desarmillaria ectypa]